MIWFYRLLYPFLSLLLSPYYLRRMLKRGGYGRKLGYSLGLWPKLPPKEKGVSRIWIQAGSVGELSSIGKLLESFGKRLKLGKLLKHGTANFVWICFVQHIFVITLEITQGVGLL